MFRKPLILFFIVLIAHKSSTITIIPEITGRKIAEAAKVMELPNSTDENTGLPMPPVVVVDAALVNPVKVWIVAAAPPPPIIASAHLIRGDISTITEAVKMIPAITATGEAIVSRRLSTHGIK